MSTTNTQNILFIDAAVGDISSILASVDPSFEVVLLSGDRNGLEQIADALAGRTGVDSVHVISHGGPGYLQLGDGSIDLSGLDGQSDALATISAALSDDADLLLYGCDVAAGDAGANFINALAAATGADVAASIDLTGPTLLGGDGTLEANTGTIEAEVLDLIGIETLLGAPANDGFENNFTGWTTSDAVVGTGGLYATDGPDWTVNPYGTKMAVVQPAGASGEKTGTYDTLSLGTAARTYLDGRFPNPTNFGYIYTTVTLTAGEEFSMAWNYVATDYSPFNDASVVTFVNTTNTSDLSMQIRPGADSSFSGGQVGILGATVAGTGNYVTGNYGSTGWQVVTLKAGEAGTYKLGFAVFNLDDTILSPYLFVDQAQGTTLKDGTPFSPIPAPAVQPPPPVTNSAPVFSATTHTNGSTLTDTAADDSFATLTGKVNATDSNNDTLTFAVSAATSGTTVKTGTYGTFTITNTATGAFTYTPNDAAQARAKHVHAADQLASAQALEIQTAHAVAPVGMVAPAAHRQGSEAQRLLGRADLLADREALFGEDQAVATRREGGDVAGLLAQAFGIEEHHAVGTLVRFFRGQRRGFVHAQAPLSFGAFPTSFASSAFSARSSAFSARSSAATSTRRFQPTTTS